MNLMEEELFSLWGLCPQAPGIYRFPPEWTLSKTAKTRSAGTAFAVPVHSGRWTALRSHPCVAVSSVPGGISRCRREGEELSETSCRS
jgi:hypothetical protein